MTRREYRGERAEVSEKKEP